MSAPRNWTSTTLGKLATYINGRGFKKSEWSLSGIPIIRIQNLTESSEKVNYFSGTLDDKHKVVRGDLLLSWAATLDVFEFKQPVGALNQHIFKVEVSAGVDKRFLYHLLKYKISDLYAQTHGSGMVHITAGKFKNIPVNLPQIREQEKIVAKIEELFSEIDNAVINLKKNTEYCEVYYMSLLNATFNGVYSQSIDPKNLDETISNINFEVKNSSKRPTTITSFQLPKLSGGWRWTTIGNVAKQVSYGSSKKSLPTGRVPVIRMGNIQSGRISWQNLKYTNDSDEIKKYTLKPGDVLFNRTNSPELVGKSAIYNGERDAVYAGYLIKIKVAEGINPSYMNYFLQSPIARHYGNFVKTDGVNQSNINGQKLLSYPFPLTTLDEQNKAVEFLDIWKSNLDAIRVDTGIGIAQALELKQSVLSKAFKGELV